MTGEGSAEPDVRRPSRDDLHQSTADLHVIVGMDLGFRDLFLDLFEQRSHVLFGIPAIDTSKWC